MPFIETLKSRVRKKAHLSCCLCQAIGVEVHLVPEEEDGPDTEDNAVPLCPSCHETYGANPQKRKFIRETRDLWYQNGRSAGNIDVVLVAYDDNGRVYDFGALEIQAVYISGNVRDPFEYFMKDLQGRASMDWSKEPNYPRKSSVNTVYFRGSRTL